MLRQKKQKQTPTDFQRYRECEVELAHSLVLKKSG